MIPTKIQLYPSNFHMQTFIPKHANNPIRNHLKKIDKQGLTLNKTLIHRLFSLIY